MEHNLPMLARAIAVLLILAPIAAHTQRRGATRHARPWIAASLTFGRANVPTGTKTTPAPVNKAGVS